MRIHIANGRLVDPAHEIDQPHDLFIADECFLTGTGAELIPVVKIDGRSIGDGKPGPITRKLVEAYRELTRTTGESI